MSTIFGIFDRTGKVLEKSTIQSIEDILSYWKPDNRGRWEDGPIALGHLMLWNTPESTLESLPRSINLKHRNLVITIDARLDNREVLYEQLEMTDLPLEKITDSEFVLAAYQKWGEECPNYLLGDFTFVIWDGNKQHLFCVRDHIGIKPFYYYLSDDLFVFSNDERGLISHDGISKKYNDRSIAMCLKGDIGFYDEQNTLFEKIQKLPAATYMTVSKENSSKTVYWNTNNITELHYDTYEAYVKKLQELLYSAVKVRLRTIYPVASHLSGGIDSTSVSVLAARELRSKGQSLYAFNWVELPDDEYDPNYCEWGFGTRIASLEKIEQKNITVTAELIAELFNRTNIPKNAVSYFWAEFLVRDEAEKCGIRTILSGWGGDELISNNGYAYLSGLLWQGHFIKAIKKIYALYSYKKVRYKYLRTIKKMLRESIYPLFYKQMAGLYKEKKSKYDAHEFTQGQFSELIKKLSFNKLEFHPGVHRDQKALFKYGHLLQRIESWASSAFENKLEYSYPLLDKRIVEFALAIPEDMYAWKEGHQRYFFRSVISNFLPKDIAWEAKIREPEHVKAWIELSNEAIQLWIQKNEKTKHDKNYYMDREKIIQRIKIYLSNQKDEVDDNISIIKILDLIFLFNLSREK